MRSLKLFLIVLPMLAAVTAGAQVTKIPAKQIDIQKMVMARPVTRVNVMPDTEKLKMVQTALKNKGVALTKTSSLTVPIKLDVRTPFIDGKARMYFDWASEVSASENVVDFDQISKVEPRIRLFYNAPTPGYYVFDFAVGNPYWSTNPQLQFSNLFVDVQAPKLLDKGDGVQHQIFITNVKTPGWNLILLDSKSGYWEFYSVEISQFK
ncbi:MAG: hypothetical protein ACKVQJ_00280 [Pyrinomonadaceae bacterium]